MFYHKHHFLLLTFYLSRKAIFLLRLFGRFSHCFESLRRKPESGFERSLRGFLSKIFQTLTQVSFTGGGKFFLIIYPPENGHQFLQPVYFPKESFFVNVKISVYFPVDPQVQQFSWLGGVTWASFIARHSEFPFSAQAAVFSANWTPDEMTSVKNGEIDFGRYFRLIILFLVFHKDSRTKLADV